ncbi:hypothetical protein GCM10027167_09120 [Nocardia heshunensis]
MISAKLLFSATPTYGHILPLVPLMQAAIDPGHTVGLLSSARFRTTTVLVAEWYILEVLV